MRRDQWLAWCAAAPAAVLIGAGVGLIAHSFSTGDGWFHGDSPAPSAEALMDAVTRPDLADVDALLLAGQPPDVRVPYQDRRVTRGAIIDVSPLFVAVARGDDNVSALLLTAADLTRLENREALCAAAHMGRRDLVGRLLAAGADPDLVCSMYGDMTPAELADSRRYEAVAADLREWTAVSQGGTHTNVSTVSDVRH